MATITANRRAGNSAERVLVRRLADQIEHIDRSHRPLLQAIAAAPDDDLPRMVYADWLEERGQVERAIMIRSQVRNPNEYRPKFTARTIDYTTPGDLEHLRPHNPRRLAARIIATSTLADCPLWLRWLRGVLHQWSHGRYEKLTKSELGFQLLARVQDELHRIHGDELKVWERCGRLTLPPKMRSVSSVLPKVVNEVAKHVYLASYPDPASLANPTTPDDWHFTLAGFDDDLGVSRPESFVRLSRVTGHYFHRGFAAVGEFVWPHGWRLDHVAAVFARQPVARVLLRNPNLPAGLNCGGRWHIRRGRWRESRSLLTGTLPAAAFDLLAAQRNDLETDTLKFHSEGEAEIAVTRIEESVNDAIRLASAGASPRLRLQSV